MSRAFNFDDLYQSYYTWHLAVRMSTKHNGMHYALSRHCGMHYALSSGTINRRGYSGQQKGTISDDCGPYPALILCQFFTEFDWLAVLMSPLDAYILRYGDFCANDDNDNKDDTTDYFTPCACAQGNYHHYTNTSYRGYYDWTEKIRYNHVTWLTLADVLVTEAVVASICKIATLRFTLRM